MTQGSGGSSGGRREGLWARAEAIFDQALDQPADTREAFVVAECGADDALRERVLALLEADSGDVPILDAGLDSVVRAVFDWQPPESFAQYRTLRLLGRGGFGSVYLAEDADLGRTAAIKFLPEAGLSPERVAGFLDEPRTQARLSHEGIAATYGVGVLNDGTPYFAMEFVDGPTIVQHCERAKASRAERLALFTTVCEAVMHAHANGVIHRDIKPQNILVAETSTPKLLDFGIAALLTGGERDGGGGGVPDGLVAVTPQYAAPEQLEGGATDIRTDVYALGLLLYELLSGTRAFPADRATPEAGSALSDVLPPPSAQGRGVRKRRIDRDLGLICSKALAKDAEHRYQTVDAMIRDLEAARRGFPLEAGPGTAWYRAGRFLRRNRGPIAAVLIVLVALVGVSVFYTVRLRAARDASVDEARRVTRVQDFVQTLIAGDQAFLPPLDTLTVAAMLERGVRDARLLSAEPDIQADLYELLGTSYQLRGRHEVADSLLQLSLSQRREVFGPDHPEVAKALVALGHLKLTRQDPEGAAEDYRLASGMVDRSRETDGVTALMALAGLGAAFQAMGDYGEAEDALATAVEEMEKHLPGSPELIAATNLLGMNSTYRTSFERADSLFGRVAAMAADLYGPDHPNNVVFLINRATNYGQLGRSEEAEDAIRRGLRIVEEHFGKDSPLLPQILDLHGAALTNSGRPAEAAAAHRRAAELNDALYGSASRSRGVSLLHLATAERRLGRPDDATATLARAGEILRGTLPPNHWHVISVKYLEAQIALDRGLTAEAVALFEEALERQVEAIGPWNPGTTGARSGLGAALHAEGRLVEAEEHLRAAFEILTSTPGVEEARITTTRQRLTAVLEALGRSEEARAVLEGANARDSVSNRE
ncbi:MAG: serine/threonine-protein kinase [Longimicrobiales bacterium]